MQAKLEAYLGCTQIVIEYEADTIEDVIECLHKLNAAVYGNSPVVTGPQVDAVTDYGPAAKN